MKVTWTWLLLLLASLLSPASLQGVRSPLLQVWGVNLAGTRRLSPAEVWGAGISRVQNVAFDPDEGARLRSSYQKRFGTRGEQLIELLGRGRHVDQAARELNSVHASHR